jgi:membrane-associated phospholipid phosphatase
VAAAVMVLLLRYDVLLMRWRYLIVGDEPQGLFKQFLGSVREFGQMMAAVVAICIVATCDRRRATIIATLLLAEVICSAGFNAGKLTIMRYRPYAAIDAFKTGDETDKPAILARMRPGDSWSGWEPMNKSSHTQSFPSGHSAAAFVLAGTLAAFYPRLAWLLWTLAVCCALSRYLDAVHWLSDCFAGSLIGYTSAWMAARIPGIFVCRPPAVEVSSVDSPETIGHWKKAHS